MNTKLLDTIKFITPIIIAATLLVSVSSVQAAEEYQGQHKYEQLLKECVQGDVASCTTYCNDTYDMDWDTQDTCESVEGMNKYKL